MRDALWLHFIDNSGALAALVRGSSSVTSGDAIVGETWSLIFELNVVPWFDRVATKANPVDGLSPSTLVPVRIPDSLLRELRI